MDKKQLGKSRHSLNERVKLERKTLAHQKQLLKEMKNKHAQLTKKAGQNLESRKERDEASIDKLELEMVTQKETRNYNLATSLKSYIDPRIYYEWGKQVEYDWKHYYSKTLQKKFNWVETRRLPENG